jgi:phasin family protein
MNEDPFHHATNILPVAIPENVQQISQQSVEKSRDLYQQMNSASTEGLKAIEGVMLASHAGLKVLTEKVASNTAANTEAAFEAAQAIAHAKTLPEAVRLQANFLQQQFATAGAQTKELCELSMKVSQETFDVVSQAATRSFDKINKVS